MGEVLHNTYVLFISLMYLFLFILYFIREVFYITKVNDIKIISYVRFMYSLVYGLIPCIVHMNYYLTGSVTSRIDYSQYGMYKNTILIILSIVGYLSLSFGYLLKLDVRNSTACRRRLRGLPLAAMICLVIGFVSILVWTHVYGSPFNMIPDADLIRSRRSRVYNPFAFMKHTSALVMFASYLYYIILKEHRTRNRFLTFLLLCFSVFWSAFYIVVNDGRMLAAIYFAIFIMANYRIALVEGKTEIRKTLICYILLAIICLVAISASESILRYIQYGTWREIGSTSVFEILRQEFGYTIVSGQTALTVWIEGLYGYRFFEDIKSAIFAWVPTRFTRNMFTTLFDFNTSLIPGTSGQVPTDFISMCIYSLGLFGVMILPFIFGLFIKVVEMKLSNKAKQDNYYNVIYTLIAFYMLKSISHSDINNILINVFYIVVGHLVVLFVQRLFKSSEWSGLNP